MPFKLPPDTHIARVELQVADLDSARSFYTDVIGFQSRNTDLFTQGAGPLIRLVEHPGATPKPRRTAGLFHIAVRVPGRIALSRVAHRLHKHGWPLSGASDHGVSEALYLSDPDGNGLEIYTDRDRAHWPMNGDQVAMFSVPLDMDALLRETEGDDRAGLPAHTDIGHIHLQVSSLQAAEHFYCHLLGFDVMQDTYCGALFVAAGGYHHHLGLNVWAGEGVPPAPENAAGLRSFSIAITDAQALDELHRHLQDAGIAVKKTPDGLETRDPDQNAVMLAVEP